MIRVVLLAILAFTIKSNNLLGATGNICRWIGADNGNISQASNWSSHPESTDIFLFSSNCTITIDVATFEGAQIRIADNVVVNWVISARNTNFNIGNGTSGDDFIIGAGATLNIVEGLANTGNYATVNILSGNTAAINGKLVLKGGTGQDGSKLLAFGTGAIIVNNGASIEVATGLKGYPFYNGSDATANVVVFKPGSKYIQNSADVLSPFGENSSNKLIVKTSFEAGSLYQVKSTSAIDIYRRRYADIEVLENNIATLGIQNVNDGAFTFDNLILNGKSFTVSRYDDNGTKNIYIKGNITGVGAASLSFSTGNSGGIYFSGGTTQTIIGGTGEFLFDPGQNSNGAFFVDNNTTLKLERNITLQAGKNFTIRSGCVLDVGTAVLLSKSGKANIKGNESSPGVIRTASPYGLYGGNGTSFPSDYWNTPTFNGFSYIEYYKEGDQLISTGFEYPDLVLSGSGTKTITGDFTKQKNMTIKADVIFDNLAYSITNNGGNFDIYGTFRTSNMYGFVGGGNERNPAITNFPTIYLRSGSTVEYSATSGEQLISPLEVKDGLCYQSLKMTGGSLKKLYPTNENITCLVKENLILENGIVTFQSKNGFPMLTLDTGAVVTGGSDISFVDSFMYRKTAKIGSFPFPVGKRHGSSPYSKYRPFIITTTSTDATTFSGEYFSVGDSKINATTTGILSALLNREYWESARTGSASAVVSLPYIASIAGTSWSPSMSPTGRNVIVAQYLDRGIQTSPSSLWYSPTANKFTEQQSRPVESSGNVSSTTLTDFANSSHFTFGLAFTIILPVKIISFTGNIQQNKTLLQLKVVDSKEFSAMDVEYSTDGKYFSSIGSLVADVQDTYSFLHTRPAEGINYYRIAFHNTANGKLSYSNVVTVPYNLHSTTILGLQTTVVSNDAVININSTKPQKVSAKLADSGGRMILQKSWLLQPGNNQLNISNLSILHAGLYFLQIVTDDGVRKTLSFVKD